MNIFCYVYQNLPSEDLSRDVIQSKLIVRGCLMKEEGYCCKPDLMYLVRMFCAVILIGFSISEGLGGMDR